METRGQDGKHDSDKTLLFSSLLFSRSRRLGGVLIVTATGCAEDDPSFAHSEAADEVRTREFSLQDGPRAMAATNKVATINSGMAYVEECRDAGVPVPDTVIDINADWILVNDPIATLFMEPDLKSAELWTFEDDDGICMALPRASNSSALAEVVGMICMGWNGMTCYFTNAGGDFFSQAEAIPITELAGGTDLELAPEGVCSDCHAGENPFIIHPEDDAFELLLNIRPAAWPTPIVPEAFPGNPEPLDYLGAVSDDQLRCDECHSRNGTAGRLPTLQAEYDEFCDSVLAPAVASTMPPSPGSASAYMDHIAWLSNICDVPSNVGVVVPFTPPPSMVIRPPDVDPPYQCSRHVRVSNAVYGATLKLYLNGAPLAAASGVFRDPEAGYVFNLTSNLTTATLVAVTQTVGGVESTPTVVSVRDHTVDYPDGLPPPIIAPAPIYECARAFAVINVAGAELTAVKTPPTGIASSYTVRSGASHTWISGLGTTAFTIGTSFKVRQKICTDVSDYSEVVVAEDAPSTLPDMTLDPIPTVGQPIVSFGGIVQGAGVTLRRLRKIKATVGTSGETCSSTRHGSCLA